MRHYTFILCLFLAVTAIHAQNTGEGIPASTNVSNAGYPRLLPDNRVIFQVNAPVANNVQTDLGKKYDLAKNESGVWKVITDPQVAGFHYYSLKTGGHTWMNCRIFLATTLPQLFK